MDAQAQTGVGISAPAATADEGEGSDSTRTEQIDLRQKSADIVCALNFGLCLLHTPQSALAYLRCVAATDVACRTSRPFILIARTHGAVLFIVDRSKPFDNARLLVSPSLI